MTNLSLEPPMVACVVSDPGCNFGALRSMKDCVMSIPSVALAAKVVQIGNRWGCEVPNFERSGLTSMPARRVAPPPVPECGMFVLAGWPDVQIPSIAAQYAPAYG
jgi:flavin reductase (DIM6/NTAB) family NADH-FMN oxidoreductase RutF